MRIYLILYLFYCFSSHCQDVAPINYLNQTPPGKVAKVFAPGILSTEYIEHSSPAFSPLGDVVLWAIMEMPSYQTKLREMIYDGVKWSGPYAPGFGNTSANEVYPNFSARGDTLFFCSDRNSTSPSTSTIWYVVRETNGWSRAKVLDQGIYKKDIYANSVAETGNRYFTIGPQGSSDWNIYTTDSQGGLNPMPSEINTKGYEDGPFIAADESFLIFESDRPTGVEGNIDLYISFRSKNGSWGEAFNMGAQINTHFAERFARVSPDGKYLFFGRNTGQGFDIYWISAEVIEDLKVMAVK